MDGASALPRQNGELVFQAPWESRAFGLAVTLSESGQLEWKDFWEALVTEIAASQQSNDDTLYYEQWLAALEKLALAKGLVTEADLDARARYIASHQGHDHD